MKYPRDRDIPRIYLRQGEMYFSGRPALIKTILGSCIAVVMVHQPSGVGAVCHGLLPTCRSGASHGHGCPEKYKYVDCSITHMTRKFDRLGMKRDQIEAKVFGGADVLQLRDGRCADITVGKRNIEAALDSLSRERLSLISYDVGGDRGRKLFIYTHTGEVFLKRLKQNGDLEDEEA